MKKKDESCSLIKVGKIRIPKRTMVGPMEEQSMHLNPLPVSQRTLPVIQDRKTFHPPHPFHTAKTHLFILHILKTLKFFTSQTISIMPIPTSSLKLLLMSAGVLSIAMAMKFTVPFITDFIIYQLPSIWSFMASMLRPPYLYIVINVIIISIAASSCFHHKDRQLQSDHSETFLKSPPLIELQTVFQLDDSRPSFYTAQLETVLINNNNEEEFVISKSNWTPISPEIENLELESLPTPERSMALSRLSHRKPVKASPEVVESWSNWTPILRTISPDIQNLELESLPTPERPLALSRFSHRKPVKASPEGSRGLRVAKPRKQETLENTWKMITDGRHMPLTRHFKKPDLRENQGLQCDESPKKTTVKKSETVTGRIRKEASLSNDDLNRRVEAFINKFNEDMRLERQESLRQYKEMIDREARSR